MTSTCGYNKLKECDWYNFSFEKINRFFKISHVSQRLNAVNDLNESAICEPCQL